MKSTFTKLLVAAVLLVFVGGCSGTDTLKKDAESLQKILVEAKNESGQKINELEEKLSSDSAMTKEETIAILQDMKSEYEKTVQKIKDFKPENSQVKVLQSTIVEVYQKAADSMQTSINEAKDANEDGMSDLTDKVQGNYQKVLNALNAAEETLSKLVSDKK